MSTEADYLNRWCLAWFYFLRLFSDAYNYETIKVRANTHILGADDRDGARARAWSKEEKKKKHEQTKERMWGREWDRIGSKTSLALQRNAKWPWIIASSGLKVGAVRRTRRSYTIRTERCWVYGQENERKSVRRACIEDIGSETKEPAETKRKKKKQEDRILDHRATVFTLESLSYSW